MQYWMYWDYCDTAETYEDLLNQFLWSANVDNCINPSEAMLNAIGWYNLNLVDSWECCCEIASTPNNPGSLLGYEGSVCEEYMSSISIEENINKHIDNIYIDIFGRTYITQPKGLSIMNNKKYYKF